MPPTQWKFATFTRWKVPLNCQVINCNIYKFFTHHSLWGKETSIFFSIFIHKTEVFPSFPSWIFYIIMMHLWSVYKVSFTSFFYKNTCQGQDVGREEVDGVDEKTFLYPKWGRKKRDESLLVLSPAAQCNFLFK